MGKRCKLPQRVWAGAPAEIEFCAFLALKSDIWWHQIYYFFWKSIDHNVSRVRLNLGPSHALGGTVPRLQAWNRHSRSHTLRCALVRCAICKRNRWELLYWVTVSRAATRSVLLCERPFCLGVGLAVVLVAHVHTHHTTPLCYTGSGIIRPRLYKLNRKSTRSPIRSSFFGERVIS